jgi:hypothetical protein
MKSMKTTKSFGQHGSDGVNLPQARSGYNITETKAGLTNELRTYLYEICIKDSMFQNKNH